MHPPITKHRRIVHDPLLRSFVACNEYCVLCSPCPLPMHTLNKGAATKPLKLRRSKRTHTKGQAGGEEREVEKMREEGEGRQTGPCRDEREN